MNDRASHAKSVLLNSKHNPVVLFGLLGRDKKIMIFTLSLQADSRNQNHLTAIYSMLICLSQRVEMFLKEKFSQDIFIAVPLGAS